MEDDFESWINRIGLGGFAGVFIREGIDFDIIADLEEKDLEKLGLGMGHRKRFLRAVANLDNRLPAPEPMQSANVMLDTPSLPAPRLDTSPKMRGVDGHRTPSAPSPNTSISHDEYSPKATASLQNESERRQSAILFADLTGYTSLSAELDPEELQDVMSEFFRIADTAIETNGGTVDKHLGDGVMAVFGAPISHGDDTLRAVRAAAQIHTGMQHWSANLDRDLSSHIGIAAGEVLAGSDINQYTVIGDAVNLASRLSDLAKPHETFLSDEVHAEIKHEMHCDDLGRIEIKGLVDPVTVWKVIGEREHPLERDLLPYVGREAERAQFNSTIATIPSLGSGAAFIFRGEPGIGKTRLATECLSVAEENGFQSHHVLVLDFGGATGADPLRAMFRSLLEVESDFDPDKRKELADQLVGEPGFNADDAAFIYDMLTIPMPEDMDAFYRAVENTTRNRRKADVLFRVLERAARLRPQIILVEDLHWADRVTRDLCASLVSRSAECPVVILMTSRIEGDPFDPEWRSGTGSTPIYTIDLRPLSSRETRQLATVAGLDQAEELATEMEKAGGNPLFLEMMIRSSADSHTDALTGNLRSMVQARIDRLDPIDRRAIQAASIVGQRFDLDLVRYLVDTPDYEPKGLLARSLINPMGEQFLFAHALVREGIYASITRRNAHAMHLKAANWFDGRDLILRAEHLAKAEDERASAAYLEASRALMQSLRFETAKECLAKGYNCAGAEDERYAIAMTLGEAAILSADKDVATSSYRNALEDAANDEDACRAYLGLALSYRDRPDVPVRDVKEALDRSDALANKLGSSELKIESLYYRTYMHNLAAEPPQCLQAAQSAFDLLDENIPPKLRTSTYECLSMANYINGRIRTSIPLSRKMLSLSDEHGIRDKRLMAGYQIGICLYYLFKFTDGIRAVTDAVADAERYGVFRAAVISNEVASRNHLALGNFEQATHFAERSIGFAEAAGMRARVALAFIRLVDIALAMGDATAASNYAAKVLEVSDSTYVRPWALAIAGRANQDQAKAEALFAEADLMLSSRDCIAHDHFHIRALQMDDALDRSDWAAIELAAEKLEDFTRSEPLPWTDFHIKRGRLIAKWGRGEKDDAYGSLLAGLRQTRKETGYKIWFPDD